MPQCVEEWGFIHSTQSIFILQKREIKLLLINANYAYPYYVKAPCLHTDGHYPAYSSFSSPITPNCVTTKKHVFILHLIDSLGAAWWRGG